ncbi:MAG TPA: lipopolysaccharide biosynthesis protein [Caulobacteraceae bacterium]|nr:lipopolysaccharide biosynthesis protein [Caulobacteraceae bacterium]
MFRRGLVGYLPVHVVQGVVGLLTLVCFTRLLKPADYGLYALGFSTLSLCHTAVFTWLESAMARFLAPESRAGRLPAHFATLYRSWCAIAAVFAAVVVAALVVLPASLPVKAALAAGLCSILARSLVKLAQERRRAAGDVRGAAGLDIAQTVGGFLIALGLIFIGWRAAGAIAGVGMMAAICLVFVLPTELRGMSGGRFEGARARAYAAYGLPVSAALILVLALGAADRFLIAGYLGQGAVGVYHAGYTLANRTLDVLFLWLGMAGGPAMVAALERGGRPALIKAAGAQGAALIALTLPAATGLALVARPLAEVMVGPALRAGAAAVTPWIAASGFLCGMTVYYFNVAFTLGRRTSLMLVAMAIPAIANIALNVALIPRFGLQGAMWAATGSYALGAAASLVLGRRVLPLPLPARDIAGAGSASLIMALVVARLPAIGGAPELLLKAAVGAAVYGLLALLMDIGGLRGRLPHWFAPARARTAT